MNIPAYGFQLSSTLGKADVLAAFNALRILVMLGLTNSLVDGF
ncbi:hypothetical protein [Caldivirga sp. UBA161]|nr:hypothetical protein [Caldivirga sp. UBA161]